jgi:pyruvate dehydrogenase E2 component (dihydrolipoamide acetyltransferase)
MPKMGDAMEEGTLLRWLKSEGDEVNTGDPIAEIETDKVTMELEAEDSGTLAELIAGEGQGVAVGEAIAFIQGEGEEAPPRREQEESAAEEGGEDETRAATATAEEEKEPEREDEPRMPETEGREKEEDGRANGKADGRFRASPIVRRLARENDLDLSRVQGSGPQGRIVERDVRAALERGDARADGKAEEPERAPETAAPQVAVPEPSGEPGTEVRPLTRMQRIIAEKMTQSKQPVPHFYATVEVEMDELLDLRRQLNERLSEEGVKLSINDFVIKACAVALGKFPNLNAFYTTEGIETHEKVDLSMAVALDAGLIAPVIKDAAGKTLSAISGEAKDLAGRAREGGLKPEEYSGGTFTVSNMGMFGVESFSAIITPPQSAAVAVSAITRRPAFDDEGNVVPSSRMKLTLSADHRVANGAEGALYMAEVKRLLESPMLLMV